MRLRAPWPRSFGVWSRVGEGKGHFSREGKGVGKGQALWVVVGGSAG